MLSRSTSLAPQTWQWFMYSRIRTVLHLRKNSISVNLTSILTVQQLGHSSLRSITKSPVHPWLLAHPVHEYFGGKKVFGFGAHGWSNLTEPQLHPFLTLRPCLPICCCPTQIDVPTLLFSHPEITPNISYHRLPAISKSDLSQFTHDQLNNQVDLIKDGLCIQRRQKYDIVDSVSVLNYTTRAMKLTCGKLMNQDNWMDW